MKRLHTMMVLAIMVIGLLAGPVASADDNTCWLEATNSDLYITVWDLDAEGNEMVKIWDGLLTRAGRQKLVTSNGKIRYYINISDESNSAGIDEPCRNAETISLP